MAYESDTSAVTDALKSANTSVFTDATINAILNLATKDNTKVQFDQATPDANGNVTVAAGAEVVLVAASDTLQTITPPKNAPVVIFQGRGGVVATLNDGVTVPSSDPTKVDRIVVGSAGNDKIVVADARNTKIVLGSGDSSVVVGGGVDTVEAGLGNSTITGGSGDYAVVKLGGSATNYQVTVQNGHAVVTNKATTKVTDISKIQYVQLDGGKALVFAQDTTEAAVTTLYETTFGRTADAGGLNYWFDLAKAGVSLSQIASAFTKTAEYADKANLSDTDFVQSLYQNTFGRAGEAGGMQYWTDALQHGASRADLIAQFSQIAAHNIAGTAEHQEAQVVGSVTIVHNIV